MANIQKIRQKIIDRAYYLSSHRKKKCLMIIWSVATSNTRYSKGVLKRNYQKMREVRNIVLKVQPEIDD